MFARLRFQVNIIIYPDSYVSLPESRLTANLHGYVENNQDQRRREERARRRLEEGNLTWVEDADSLLVGGFHDISTLRSGKPTYL